MNKLFIQVDAKQENIKFLRTSVAAFLVPANPSVGELSDIKTAVSEAVTNCIVHGYQGNENGQIYINCTLDGNEFTISIADDGVGIKDIKQACQPFFTTKKEEEHSGMGLTIMDTFMDTLDVQNKPEGGLIVTMSKSLENCKQDVSAM